MVVPSMTFNEDGETSDHIAVANKVSPFFWQNRLGQALSV